jgi:hypothetical protein
MADGNDFFLNYSKEASWASLEKGIQEKYVSSQNSAA